MACCCSCNNLDTKKKASGEASGTRYYCKKLKTYVGGDQPACEKFSTSYRSTNDINKIYNEGKNWSNDTTSVGAYLTILAVLIVLLIILKIFNLA